VWRRRARQRHGAWGAGLTKRENASLNSETCSSVRESACGSGQRCRAAQRAGWRRMFSKAGYGASSGQRAARGGRTMLAGGVFAGVAEGCARRGGREGAGGSGGRRGRGEECGVQEMRRARGRRGGAACQIEGGRFGAQSGKRQPGRSNGTYLPTCACPANASPSAILGSLGTSHDASPALS
jgi:hypothetical protein